MRDYLRRTVSLLVVSSISLSIIGHISETEAQDPPFPDMATSWFGYQESVEYLIGREAIEGYPDGTFKPKAPINRAEFLKIVFRSRSDTEAASGQCFTDVPEDAWFAPYVCAAMRRKIVNGYPDGTFKPEQTVNVAEAMKMLLLAYGPDMQEPTGEHWYKPYTDEFDDTGVFPRHSYHPWEPLNRERAADLLAKMLRYEDDRIIPNMSAGCGKAERDASSSVMVNDTDRPFLLTKPKRYVSHDPYPLIIAFHGRTNSNEDVRRYFGFDREATDYFIAYPAALQHDSGTFHWTNGNDKIGTLRDVAFFDAIVEELAASYCIDLDKIFVAGHSLGAWFANSVACARGDVIRGSATVGGNSMIAPCTGAAAAMIINNPDDTLSPHKSAEMVRDMRIATNACTQKTIETDPESLLCQRYLGCSGENPVVWCPHEIDRDNGTYYPHLWPDDAADAIVEFFDDL